jgi:hypothetical protein
MTKTLPIANTAAPTSKTAFFGSPFVAAMFQLRGTIEHHRQRDIIAVASSRRKKDYPTAKGKGRYNTSCPKKTFSKIESSGWERGLMLDRAFYRRLISATGIEDYALLASKIGASDKSIYKWVNGTSEPSADHLYQLLALAGWLTPSVGGLR